MIKVNSKNNVTSEIFPNKKFFAYHFFINLVPTVDLTIFIISSLLLTSTGTLKISNHKQIVRKQKIG